MSDLKSIIGGVKLLMLTRNQSGEPRNSRLLCKLSLERCITASSARINLYRQDSDTNPNTTASSIIGDSTPADGRKKRSEATQLRKSVFGKKHNRLDESKVFVSSDAF